MKENSIISKNKNIENLIYEIRGKQVMLDSDLAVLYKCVNGTKTINQAVNRHLDRFPEDFYFKLTKQEYIDLKSQFGTSSLINNHGGNRKLPYVFTEQGVAMLSSVLRTKVASEISLKIMRAFVAMRKYISSNLLEQKYINNLVLEDHELLKETNDEVKLLQESFDEFKKKKKATDIYFSGQIYDAYSVVVDIFKTSKKDLVIIDSYADKTILDIIKRLNVKVVLITKKNNLLTKQDIDMYNKQYKNLKVVFNNTFHDRYLILDKNIVYHCGTSVNRIGYKTFCINLINDIKVCEPLINRVKKIIKNYEINKLN